MKLYLKAPPNGKDESHKHFFFFLNAWLIFCQHQQSQAWQLCQLHGITIRALCLKVKNEILTIYRFLFSFKIFYPKKEGVGAHKHKACKSRLGETNQTFHNGKEESKLKDTRCRKNNVTSTMAGTIISPLMRNDGQQIPASAARS